MTIASTVDCPTRAQKKVMTTEIATIFTVKAPR